MNFLRKLFISIFLTFAPTLFILLTTPSSNWFEHISHMILFIVIGGSMAGYYARQNITKKQLWKFLPALSTLTILVIFLFIATHAMPCPDMFSPHTAQTMIDHPCSQPTTPSIPIFSFNPIPERFMQFTISNPVVHILGYIQTLNNKAPPIT